MQARSTGTPSKRQTARNGPGKATGPHYESLPKDELADEIEKQSVEGRPAHPEVGPRRVWRFLWIVGAVVLLAGVVIALVVGPFIGGVSIAFGVCILLANPELWADALRADDRKKAKRRVADHHPQAEPGAEQHPSRREGDVR